MHDYKKKDTKQYVIYFNETPKNIISYCKNGIVDVFMRSIKPKYLS